ncbi:MAG TPA: SDR family oxidoreductase [Ktedonobacterales bacterium]|nr:SDR family oxidoreductase [Ktedonobacterales bacterium]
MIDTGLQGRVTLVTGANHGIGAATARAFAAQGARVFLHYLRLPLNEEEGAAQRALDATEVVEAIRAQGGQAEAWEADLADPAAVPALFDRVEAAFGPVDVLVNNAAVGGAPKDTFVPLSEEALDRFERSMLTVTAASHDRHFAVNSRAVALMMAEYARRHMARGAASGRIINISTDGAYCFPEEVSYGASKAALESYSRSAAAELSRHGITVNIVSPGPIQTGWIAPEMQASIVSSIPLGRLGRPEDVADVIVFLASEQARWLTGQCLHVGGGHKM